MNKENSKVFSDILIFKPIIFEDHRGLFYESYNKIISDELNVDFIQENYSVSKRNVIRGLHYQWEKPNGKLIKCTSGSLIDYVVDIRLNSKTFGKYDSFHLKGNEPKYIWVPPGFAHGFLSLENNTHLSYKCTALYDKNGEGSINPFDSEINIDYPINQSDAILSEKDKFAQSLSDYIKNPKF